MNEWFSFLQIDSPEKIEVLNKIVTTFQIDILKEVERGGGVKEQIERLTKFLS